MAGLSKLAIWTALLRIRIGLSQPGHNHPSRLPLSRMAMS